LKNKKDFMMRDLNDLYLFAQIVEHGGFSPASRALGLPKSRLSRRIAALEERLGTRLVQRSTRTFAVTDAGRAFLQHCQAMIAEAEAAENAVAEIRAEPRGLVRVSCPVTMTQFVLGPILPAFLLRNPEVRVHVRSTNRIVHVIEENLDVGLFVHRSPLQSSMLVERMLARSEQVLVASPGLFAQGARPASPDDLKRFPALAVGGRDGPDAWELSRDDGEKSTVFCTPRLVGDSLTVLKDAAVAGAGIVRLPEFICRAEIRSGALEAVLPQWSLPAHDIHAVYPSRKGMTPAVRSFIDYLAREVAHALRRP
jgi:DNA-binding transcriptional LysR family regulator